VRDGGRDARPPPAAFAAASHQDLRHVRELAAHPRDDPPQGLDVRLVAEEVREHRLAGAEEAVQRGQSGPQALVGVGDRRPPPRVGRLAAGEPVRLACGVERALVGEVAVDRRPLDAGAVGDGLHGRPYRPDRLVQRDGRLGDPAARLVLAGGALLLAVGALLDFRRHFYLAKA
jgi:hypothetical protein